MAELATPVRVTVMVSPEAGRVLEWQVALTAPATVADALRACDIAARYTGFEAASAALGVWGRRATLAQSLRDGDRVEIYRPLRVDPKVARRERFKKQGARAAGLFANKRPGAKAGY